MREILFRGFSPDENGREKVLVNGEWITGLWVTGYYVEFNKTTYCFKEDYDRHPDNTEHYILFDQMTDWGLPNRRFQADVIPETVGQYTGFFVGSKRVFEGDILRSISDYDDSWGDTKTCEDIGVVVWDDDTFGWGVKIDNEVITLDEFMSEDVTIIGNIQYKRRLDEVRGDE